MEKSNHISKYFFLTNRHLNLELCFCTDTTRQIILDLSSSCTRMRFFLKSRGSFLIKSHYFNVMNTFLNAIRLKKEEESYDRPFKIQITFHLNFQLLRPFWPLWIVCMYAPWRHQFAGLLRVYTSVLWIPGPTVAALGP